MTTTNIFDMADTWNDGGTVFTAIKMDVTDTASDTDSLLLDLQVGSSTKFAVGKDGAAYFGGTIYHIQNSSNRLEFRNSTQTAFAWSLTSGYVFKIPQLGSIEWSGSTTSATGGGTTLELKQDASDILALERGTNAQEFRIYKTYTDASNYERAVLGWDGNEFVIDVDAAGTGSTRAIAIRQGGSEYFTMDAGLFQVKRWLWCDANATVLDDFEVRGNSTITRTWNNGGTTFTGFLMDITDTASDAASLLMDLQVGGSSVFNIGKDGATELTGLKTAISTITASSATLDTADHVVLCDATSNAITVNLPAASSSSGLQYSIKKIDSTANTVTIDASGSETIDGNLTTTIGSQYDSITISCDGSSWYIL